MLSNGFVKVAPVGESCCTTTWVSLPDSVQALLIFSRVDLVWLGASMTEFSLSKLSALEAQHSFMGILDTAGGLDTTMAGSDR